MKIGSTLEDCRSAWVNPLLSAKRKSRLNQNIDTLFFILIDIEC